MMVARMCGSVAAREMISVIVCIRITVRRIIGNASHRRMLDLHVGFAFGHLIQTTLIGICRSDEGLVPWSNYRNDRSAMLLSKMA